MVITWDRAGTMGMMITWSSVIMTVLCSGSVLLILLVCTLYVCTLGTYVMVFSTMMITWLRIVPCILSRRRIVFSVATTGRVVVLIWWYPIFFVSAHFLWCLRVIQNIGVRLSGGGQEEDAGLLAVLLCQNNGRNGGIWQSCMSILAEKLTSILHMHVQHVVHIFVLMDIHLLIIFNALPNFVVKNDRC